MKIAALIFGLLGSVGSGFLGYKWYSDAQTLKQVVDLTRKMAEAEKNAAGLEKLAEFDRLVNASYALMGGAVLGLVGCALVMSGQGVIAGVVFLIAFVAPLALGMTGKPAVFSFGLAVAGVLSFFVKKGIPYAPPRGRPGISREDDLVG